MDVTAANDDADRSGTEELGGMMRGSVCFSSKLHYVVVFAGLLLLYIFGAVG